jgi:hypothetical protein
MGFPAAALALALLAPAGPEIYFEQATVAYAGGRPRGPGVVTRVWHSGKRMRMEAGGGRGPALLLRLDAGEAWRLDPEAKTAVALDAERLRARTQMDVSMAGDLMGVGEEGAARTTALKAGRTIAGYPCRGFRIRSGSAVLDVYTTDRLPVGIGAFTDFLEWSGAAQGMGGLLGELQKLPGFPMETRSRVTVVGEVHETLSTVTKVAVGPIPAALFDVPEGYRRLVEEP